MSVGTATAMPSTASARRCINDVFRLCRLRCLQLCAIPRKLPRLLHGGTLRPLSPQRWCMLLMKPLPLVAAPLLKP